MKFAAILAATAQLAFACLPVVEGRLGVGLGPHVDASSAGGHYAHDEGRCAACQAQGIHAVMQAFVPLGVFRVQFADVETLPPTPVESAEHFPSQSRAPPALS